MNERDRQSVGSYLQKKDVQENIRRNIKLGRSEAAVTIGRAARLFKFSENQLRDWENRGLLHPSRPAGPNGQRQYSLAELDKLAIIRELIDAKYSPGEIPLDVDSIWNAVSHISDQQEQTLGLDGKTSTYRPGMERLSIDQHIEQADQSMFWRFYASQALRLSLMLLCEDVTDTIAGIILPFHIKSYYDWLNQPNQSSDLSKLGECLIGWLDRNRSFYLFIDPAPSFKYDTDFRMHSLTVMEKNSPKEDPTDRTVIVLQREAKPLTLGSSVVEIVQRLLAPLYELSYGWQSSVNREVNLSLNGITDFGSSSNTIDVILSNLADMVVRLGIRAGENQSCWRFCCVMLPTDSRLPLQVRSLVLRAQSKLAPHTLGTILSPDEPIISLSLRAFQSGRIIYRQIISPEDTTIAYRELEGPIGSAIAIPIGGEDGRPVAVLYVVSDKQEAFSQDDQCLLRIIGKMVEELLNTYQSRLQITEKFKDILINPRIVDSLFKDFPSENEFIGDIETLLENIKKDVAVLDKVEHRPEDEDVVSFISVDIDKQSLYANLYGDQMTRNLSKTLGLRIQEQLGILFSKQTVYKLYYSYADRFYLLLNGISLKEAREKAEKLRLALSGSYQVDAIRTSLELPTLPDSKLQISGVTVRLGVTSYKFAKLYKILRSFNDDMAVANTRAGILHFLDVALNKGRLNGGNSVFAWNPDPKVWGLEHWSPRDAD